MENNTKKLVITALLTAFTCIATMIIKIPTPTLGYIHPGDGLVLLCGVVLGPVTGALAAGVGSMLSDLFSGYGVFAPATLLIKALTAGTAGFLFHKLQHRIKGEKARYISIAIGGILGEILMALGYFLFEAGLAAFAGGSFQASALAAGFASSSAGIPFNLVQGFVGILLSILVLPVLIKIDSIREWILK